MKINVINNNLISISAFKINIDHYKRGFLIERKIKVE